MKRIICQMAMLLVGASALQFPAFAQRMTVSTPPGGLGFKQIPLPSQPPSYPYPWNQPYGSPIPNPYAATGPQVVFPYAPTPSAVPPTPTTSYNPGPNHFRRGFWLGDDYGFVTQYPYYPYYPSYPDYSVYPDYAPTAYAPTINVYYPTIYQDYQAAPTVAGSANEPSSDDGSSTWYPYNYDPYSTYSSPDDESPQQSAPDAPNAATKKQLIPVTLANSLADIAQSWKTADAANIDRHLPNGGAVRIQSDGKYVGSIPSPDYASLTASAVQSIKTTDFKYSGVRIQSNGTAVGYAVQHYRTSSGAVMPMYLSYTLDPSPQSGSYTLVAVDSSKSPLSPSMQ